MKTLFLVRHAKSSWDFPELSDFDRPLGKRGERDAPRMGDYLYHKQVAPDLLLASPARRALDTARIIAAKIGHEQEIATDRRIYHAGEVRLLEVLQEVEDRFQSIMMFGHNPGFTDFVNELTNEDIANVPTCGVCQVDFSVDQWSAVGFGQGSLIFFQYPKGLS